MVFLMHCEMDSHPVLPFMPLGEVFLPPPAPTRAEADHCKLRDIRSLLARDPNIASTINAVGQGMKLAGVIDSGSIGTRDLLIAVRQIDEDARKTKEARKDETAREATVQMRKNDKLAAQQETHRKKEIKKTLPVVPDFAPLIDFAKGGKSAFETLPEKEEKSAGVKRPGFEWPRFEWEDMSMGDLFTKTIPIGTLGHIFRNQNIALAI
jgi:hypothetical protein